MLIELAPGIKHAKNKEMAYELAFLLIIHHLEPLFIRDTYD